MSRHRAFDQLWNAPAEPGVPFRREQIGMVPLTARRYLEHAIAPGTPIASAVRLQMHGAIRLKANWHLFNADQVIRWDRGFVWRARVRIKGLPVTGFDRWIDGEGVMRWKLLSIVPILTASGPDVSRSAAERMAIEAVWLPSVLVGPDVGWSQGDVMHAGAEVRLLKHHAHFDLSLDEQGRICSQSMLRWGNPDGHGYRALPFGATVEEERTFGGFTIPSKLRVGWYFGTDRFEPEGEFFRCTIDEAVYR